MSKKNNLVFIKQSLLITSTVLIFTGCTTINRFFTSEQAEAPIKNIATNITYYTVQKGDSLYDLSRRFNVTERTLILWNDLQAPYLLSPGQTMRVSPLPGEKTWRADEEAKVPTISPSKAQSLNQAESDVNNSNDLKRPIVEHSAAPKIKTAATSLSEETSRSSTATAGVLESSKHQGNDHDTTEVSQPAFYVIQPEDSLLEIANRFNVSFSELKAWNNIEDPNLIYVGQKILLTPPAILPNKTDASLSEPSHTKPSKKLPSAQQNPPTKHSKSTASDKIDQQPIKQSRQKLPRGKIINSIQWAWPLPQRGEFTIKGLDKDHLIVSTEGTEVLAAASGDVIYAGIATNGVGKMVIINHTNGYISAYSNLQTLSVKEADKLKLGQPLGKVGKFNNESELGFEIRENGQVKEISHFYRLKTTVD